MNAICAIEQESMNLAPAQRVRMRIAEHNKRTFVDGDHLLHGLRPTSDSIQISGNDYLCLSGEKELIREQVTVLNETAITKDALMSAIFLDSNSRQNAVERKIARYLQSEDGIMCQSGYIANVGLIQCLADPETPVYLDFQAHASLWEGARAANAPVEAFLHNDLDHLRRAIKQTGPGVIAVDSLYSTDGSLCPLRELTNLAESTGCILVVDESHSIGTHGPQGAGLVVQEGLADRVPFRTFSLAKAYAGRGGFVTCSTEFKSYFGFTSRPAIFSSCMLSHELAWFDAATNFLIAADDRRARLMTVSKTLRAGLANLGYNVSTGTEQIIALEAGAEASLRRLRDSLQKRGVFGAGFCAPATPKNRTLMRLTLNSGLTDDDIGRILQVCEEIREEVDLQNWPSTKRMHRDKVSSKKFAQI